MLDRFGDEIFGGGIHTAIRTNKHKKNAHISRLKRKKKEERKKERKKGAP